MHCQFMSNFRLTLPYRAFDPGLLDLSMQGASREIRCSQQCHQDLRTIKRFQVLPTVLT